MSHIYRFALAAFLLIASLACSLVTQAFSRAGAPFAPSAPPLITSTQAGINITAQTDTPIALINPSVTTAVPVNPTKAYEESIMNTAMARMGFTSDLMGYQILYANPIGTPLQSWQGIPVMKEATAGQEFKADIYSYKANATLQQARQFYNSKSASLKWSCTISMGFGGSGSHATHSVTMACNGFSVILMTYDNDTNHVLIILSKPL
jgi:hypothetical protein